MTDPTTTDSTDTNSGWFTDADALSAYLKDTRASDDRVVSTVTDAQTLIDDFRTRTVQSPWTTLDRTEIADRLQQLIGTPRAFQQGALNLCGPATFMCMWTGRDPVGFATYATQLYDTGCGAIGTLTVQPGQELLEQDFGAMKAQMGSNPTWSADWMVLGALRNSTDVFWQGSWTGNPDQQLSALTRPEELAGWLQATGIYGSVLDHGNWVTLAGLPQAENLIVASGMDTALLIHMNLINSAQNAPQDRSFLLSQFPNHFVMLLSEVVVDVTTGLVHLSIWTWGESKLDLAVPQQDFIDNYYGAVTGRLHS